jgi:hypothetical protein
MAKFTLLSGRLETIIGTSPRNPTNAPFLVEDGFFFVGVRVFASIPQPNQLVLAFVPLVLLSHDNQRSHLNLIASRLWIGSRLGLREAVQVDAAHAEFMSAGREIL